MSEVTRIPYREPEYRFSVIDKFAVTLKAENCYRHKRSRPTSAENFAMRKQFQCSVGHTWDVTIRGSANVPLDFISCPVCGGTAETLCSDTAGTAGPHGDAGQLEQGRLSVPGYSLYEELGRGGMGVVFKARQDAL